MANIKTSLEFKTYSPTQPYLLPVSLGDLIDPGELVRIVNAFVEGIDISSLLKTYVGGGTTSYHPRMLLKVLLYAYCTKIYTSRKIAKAIRQDIHFMWLTAGNKPTFRTIGNFRSCRAKEVIEDIFKEMLNFLIEHNYIKMENYFCDGSTFRADGNQHKMVWKKNAAKYKEITEQKCKDLFTEIDALNEAEDKEYKNKDLEETGTDNRPVTLELINDHVVKLNKLIKKKTTAREKKKAEVIKKQLLNQQEKIIKYDKQIKTAGKRSGYNKTDEDASGMRMKNQEILPGYNILAGCENQMIINCSVHQNTNDATCFNDHLEQLKQLTDIVPANVIADSIFGTEENCEILEREGMENYLKYPSLHKEEKKRYKPDHSSNDAFIYDGLTDTYLCPNNKILVFKQELKTDTRLSGYQATSKIYEANDCSGCPFFDQCCGPKKEINRKLKINEKLESYKRKMRSNLQSEKGWELRKSRGVEIESCFGDIKHNMGVRRCHLRGLKKVKTDFCLIAMAHNLRKVHLLSLKMAS